MLEVLNIVSKEPLKMFSGESIASNRKTMLEVVCIAPLMACCTEPGNMIDLSSSLNKLIELTVVVWHVSDKLEVSNPTVCMETSRTCLNPDHHSTTGNALSSALITLRVTRLGTKKLYLAMPDLARPYLSQDKEKSELAF